MIGQFWRQWKRHFGHNLSQQERRTRRDVKRLQGDKSPRGCHYVSSGRRTTLPCKEVGLRVGSCLR